SDVIIPTPSDIVESGDTVVSVTVTCPVLFTVKLCVIDPSWARSALNVSVIVGAVVGAVGVVVVPQEAAHVRPTASMSAEAERRACMVPSFKEMVRSGRGRTR